MKVVLLQDVDKVGKAGDIVEVKNGYGRNYLIKNKLGVLGTRENIKAAEARQEEIRKQKEEERKAAVALAEKIDATQLVIHERASDEGTLFGSVTNKNIAEALESEMGIVVDKRKIELPDPIRNVGKFTGPIKTYAGVEGKLTVVVAAKK